MCVTWFEELRKYYATALDHDGLDALAVEDVENAFPAEATRLGLWIVVVNLQKLAAMSLEYAHCGGM